MKFKKEIEKALEDKVLPLEILKEALRWSSKDKEKDNEKELIKFMEDELAIDKKGIVQLFQGCKPCWEKIEKLPSNTIKKITEKLLDLDERGKLDNVILRKLPKRVTKKFSLGEAEEKLQGWIDSLETYNGMPMDFIILPNSILVVYYIGA